MNPKYDHDLTLTTAPIPFFQRIRLALAILCGQNERTYDKGGVNVWEEFIQPLEAQLAECYRLTGADPDGNEDWRLAERAVAQVAQFRREYDAVERANDRLLQIELGSIKNQKPKRKKKA